MLITVKMTFIDEFSQVFNTWRCF